MTRAKKHRARFASAWWVLIGVFVILFFDYGIRYSFGVFFKPLASEFDWSRGQTSLVFAAHMGVYSVSALVWGWTSDRFRARLIVTLGCIVAGACVALMYVCQSITQAILFFSVLTALGMGAIYVPSISTVGKVFRDRRGLALGIVSTAVGLSYLWSPIAEWLISDFGWRLAYLVSGVLLIAVGAPLAWMVLGVPVASRPVRERRGKAQPEAPEPYHSTRPTSKQIMSAPMLLLNLMFISALFPLYAASTHIVPYALDAGIAPPIAAMTLALVGIFSIIGRFGVGGFSDRIGRGRVFVIAFILQMAGLAMFLFIAWQPLLLFFLGAILLGIGYGSWVPQFPAAIADIFGPRNLGKLVGINTFFGTMFGATLGPYLTGHIHDVTGAYTTAFVLALGMTGVGLFLSFLLRRYLLPGV